MNPRSQPHALYRFYDDSGQLLYVGITANPGQRWTQHAHAKPWWHHVATVTLEQHPNREAVLAAERTAIITEQPRHNVVHARHTRQNATAGHPLDDYLVDHLGADPTTGPFGTHPSHMPDLCRACDNDTIHHPHAWANGRARYRCPLGHTWTCSWGHTHTADLRGVA